MPPSNDGLSQSRQARLAAFLAQLELPQESFRSETEKPIEKLKFQSASLDGFLTGGAHDIAALITALSQMGQQTRGESVMVDEAHQAIESLFEALDALDTATIAIRNFVRSYEPLVRYLTHLSTKDDHGFKIRLNDLINEKQAKAKQQGWSLPQSLDDLTLDELQRLLRPHLYDENEAAPEDWNTKVINPKRSLGNARQLRNKAAHRYLPGGVRLVPYLQETLVSLSVLFGDANRARQLQRHLSSPESLPFLIGSYLTRLKHQLKMHPLPFLAFAVDNIPDLPRRLKHQPRDTNNRQSSLKDARMTQSATAARSPHSGKNATYTDDGLAITKQFKRIWLQAEGGGGKSVFLEQLARAAAANPEHRLLPVLVRLHQFQPEQQNGNLKALIQSALNIRYNQPLPRLFGWTPLLLLDGFNELSVRHQGALLRELEEFELHWPHGRTWISSRTELPDTKHWESITLLPWTRTERRSLLSALGCRNKRLNVESFEKKLEKCHYRELVETNPLLFVMTAVYALETGADKLPLSEGLIFQHLMNGFFKRENVKHYKERGRDLSLVRVVLGQLAVLMLEQQTMTLSEETVLNVLKQHNFGTSHPLGLLLGVGLIELEGAQCRFWHQTLRAYFMAEGFARHFDQQQAALPDDPARGDASSEAEQTEFDQVLFRLESTIRDHIAPRLVAVEERYNRSGKRPEDQGQFSVATNTAMEAMTELATILHYYVDLKGAPARQALAAKCHTFPFEQGLAYWWEGWGGLMLRALARLNLAYPAEKLLDTVRAMDIFKRSLACGWDLGLPLLVMNSFAGAQLSDLAFQMARHIPLAEGYSLAEFTEGVDGRYGDEELLQAMTFPRKELVYLFRIDPDWTAKAFKRFFPLLKVGHKMEVPNKKFLYFSWISQNEWATEYQRSIEDGGDGYGYFGIYQCAWHEASHFCPFGELSDDHFWILHSFFAWVCVQRPELIPALAVQVHDEQREFPISQVFWWIDQVDYYWHLNSYRERNLAKMDNVSDPWDEANCIWEYRCHPLSPNVVLNGYSPDVWPAMLKALTGVQRTCIRRYVWGDDEATLKEWRSRQIFRDEVSLAMIDEAIAALEKTIAASSEPASAMFEPATESNP